MAVAARGLAVHEEALRRDQVQAVLGPRHRDVEQPALLLDLLRAADAEIGGMQPSTALSTKTFFHSWPLAEWMVDRIR